MKHIYKGLTLLLVFAMLATTLIFHVTAKQATVKATGFDSTRGSGELIIYTPNMGDTTKTNEWGYEVIIEDNVAVKFSTGNSAIPKNGFVLSGHDEGEGGKNMGTWIKENIEIGDYVYYTNDGKVTVSDEPVAQSAFYEITQKINGINLTRNADFLVIYNKLGQTTKTNEWGYEVVVTNGIVTALGGNNNQVPSEKGSFVVSGHGTNTTWLQENVRLGMSASYNESEKTVTFSYDESAAIRGMEMIVPALEENFNAAKERYDNLDYNAVEAAIDSLKKHVSDATKAFKKDKDGDKLSKASAEAEQMADDIELLISESRTVQYRGVWIRPTDTSAAQVEETVQKLYENGINMICIETLYNCTMIMPMPEGSLFQTNPQFKHFDMLRAYVDACHERDMELHLWLPIFYVGDYGSQYRKYSLGTKKPEWLSVSNNGKHSYEVNEELGGLMMLDPSNEDAKNYLLGTYKYILENYDVDGLQLDYIRYYDRGADYDMGYTDEALDAFEEKYGVRPQYDTNASYWNDWVNFRCEYINEFVARVRKLIDETRPGVLLGADVVPDPTRGVSHNYQNYYDWLENKWIDILFPMAYGYGYEEDIAQQNNRCGETAFLSTGLGIFVTEFGPTDMQIQFSYNNSISTDGATFFEASSYLKKQTGEYLLKGVFREKAITPTFDIEKGAKTQIAYAKSRINDIIIPMGGVSSNDGEAIIKALDALSETCTAESFDAEKYSAVKQAIDDSDANEQATARMLSDLKLSVKAYTVLNKELDLSDVPETPELPDYSESPEPDDNKSTPVEESIPDNSEEPTEPTTDDESNDTVIIILIVAVTLVICAVVIYFGLFRKSKK